MLFATDALRFFAEVGDKHDFRVEATSNWSELNDENLKQYKLVVWLNGAPPGATAAGVPAIHGKWRRVARLSCVRIYFPVGRGSSNSSEVASFGVNNWPPLPARLIVDDTESAVTRGIPRTFVSPINEWYSWRPSPRLDKNIQVLLTLDPSQYPSRHQGPDHRKRPRCSRRLDEHQIQDALHEHGARRQDLHVTHAKQADRERDSLASGCVKPLASSSIPAMAAAAFSAAGRTRR